MAFVFKSERGCNTTVKSPFPGPGQYNPEERAPVDQNPVPFLTTSQRPLNNQPEKARVPGPGTYIAPVSVQGYNTKTKTFYSAVNPEMPVLVEQKTASSTYQSSTLRFPKHRAAEAPGPGTYDLPSSIVIKGSGQNAAPFASTLGLRDKEKDSKNMPAMMKSAVPSIPSVIHSYGYTEGEYKELTLNNNPLLEIQKFVGPGYYDVPAANDYKKPKGVSWEKSKAPRGFNPELSTITIGPGAYKPKPRVHLPLYKFKQSAAFASKSTRTISDKERVRAERKKKQALKKADTNLMENPNGDENDDYDNTLTPGPGYYYNKDATSSFKLSNRQAATHQFFGSGSERFEDTMGTKTTVGPGRYNMRKEISKKFDGDEANIPFNTKVGRFAGQINEGPGPGAYDGLNSTEKKAGANDNTIERFGVLETRFKPDLETTPGPGSYQAGKVKSKSKDEKGVKTSHMFTSTSKREAIKVDNVDLPAPGTYNVGYHDLAAKAKKIEDEDLELSLKRVPFGSHIERFKQPARIDENNEYEVDEDDSFDEGWNVDGPDRGDLILKARKQPKSTSAFASKAGRSAVVINQKEKGFIPGPGKYNVGGPDEWIKKTYNVNFTAD